MYVFRSKQDLPKGVYIEMIAPKRTSEKKSNEERLRLIEIMDSIGLSGKEFEFVIA